jgi:hypothetical protein
MTDRMPGRVAPPWCPVCHGPPGPDCPARGKTPRQVRRALKRETAREAAVAESASNLARQPLVGRPSRRPSDWDPPSDAAD